MTMTSFPGSTFSWQIQKHSEEIQPRWSKIEWTTFTPMLLSTIICIQYLRGWGFGFVCACPLLSLPRLPHCSQSLLSSSTCILMAALHLVTSIILHLPPANSHGVTSNHQKVLPLCYFLPCRTHNRLIFSLISPWVRTPQGSHAHSAVHLVRFSSHVVQNPALCGAKSTSMWYKVSSHVV